MPVKKGGNKNRRGTNKHRNQTRTTKLIEAGVKDQFYGEILALVGGTTMSIACTDGTTVLARLPKTWKRKRMWARKGSIVIIQKDTPDSKSGEGIHLFSPDEARSLQSQGHLHGIIKKNKGGLRDDDVVFDDAEGEDFKTYKVTDAHAQEPELQYFPPGFSDDDEGESIDDEVARITSKYASDVMGNFIDDEGVIIDVEALTAKIIKRRQGGKKKKQLRKRNEVAVVSQKQTEWDSDDNISFGDDDDDEEGEADGESDDSFDIDDI
jgi:initiation factor 1A